MKRAAEVALDEKELDVTRQKMESLGLETDFSIDALKELLKIGVTSGVLEAVDVIAFTLSTGRLKRKIYDNDNFWKQLYELKFGKIDKDLPTEYVIDDNALVGYRRKFLFRERMKVNIVIENEKIYYTLRFALSLKKDKTKIKIETDVVREGNQVMFKIYIHGTTAFSNTIRFIERIRSRFIESQVLGLTKANIIIDMTERGSIVLSVPIFRKEYTNEMSSIQYISFHSIWKDYKFGRKRPRAGVKNNPAFVSCHVCHKTAKFQCCDLKQYCSTQCQVKDMYGDHNQEQHTYNNEK